MTVAMDLCGLAATSVCRSLPYDTLVSMGRVRKEGEYARAESTAWTYRPLHVHVCNIYPCLSRVYYYIVSLSLCMDPVQTT